MARHLYSRDQGRISFIDRPFRKLRATDIGPHRNEALTAPFCAFIVDVIRDCYQLSKNMANIKLVNPSDIHLMESDY